MGHGLKRKRRNTADVGIERSWPSGNREFKRSRSHGKNQEEFGKRYADEKTSTHDRS
jgi:hypothetical protein